MISWKKYNCIRRKTLMTNWIQWVERWIFLVVLWTKTYRPLSSVGKFLTNPPKWIPFFLWITVCPANEFDLTCFKFEWSIRSHVPSEPSTFSLTHRNYYFIFTSQIAWSTRKLLVKSRLSPITNCAHTKRLHGKAAQFLPFESISRNLSI